MDKIRGAQIMFKCLKEEGVEVIFGYPGAAVMPIYDALLDSDIRHILVRHEQGAAHAADGYARATGKTGVCLATSGPGATNLITGIANANMDSIPLVAITGQVATDKIGTDAFQETDTIGITSPITKHNYLVKDVKELPRIIKEAFHIASTGRPGPVVIDIPIDILNSLVSDNIKAKIDLPGYKPTYKGNINQIRQAAGIIHKSNKPVLFAGGGIVSSGASDILTKFARNAKIPVINSLMGLGCFPADDELSLGMAGVCGSVYANKVFSLTDLIIAAGVRFDDRVTGKISKFAPNAKIIHIDIDPAEIGKNITPLIPIVGDARSILEDLVKEYEKIHDKNVLKRKKWLSTINKLKNKFSVKYDKGTNKLNPSYIIETIYELTGGHAIICTEVGQHQIWVTQFFKFTKPRTFISSGGLGAMGFGLPAAIGAKVGRPDKIVIDIAGDGSIQMVAQELATAVTNRIPVKIMVLNNGYLGMVRQLQQLLYNGRYSGVCINNSVDFAMLAEAYGATGFRVREKNEVKDTIKKALEIENVALIDFLIDREENVYPIVAPGNPLVQVK